MPTFVINGVRLAGIAACVPGERSPVQGGAGPAPPELTKVIANTGVRARHLAPSNVCTSDLCATAAERILARLGWEKSSIDLLIFVTQTPDYVLPATACALHGRLGLAKSCAAFDVNLGCSGFVYGLSIVAAHIQAGAATRALLLVGDTISKVVSPEDRSVAYLFGDAGTATAIERKSGAAPIVFCNGSDGQGSEHLQIPAGMFRTRSSDATRVTRPRESGNLRSEEQLYMNGAEIFNFTIREVPVLVSGVLKAAGWREEEVDAFVLHQANRFMLDYLSKRMKLPPERVVLALEDFGNTSSASIPLAICDRLHERLQQSPAKLLLAGFGVGFSWSAAAVPFDCPVIEPVINSNLA